MLLIFHQACLAVDAIDAENPQTEDEQKKEEYWLPTEPVPEKFDWIQLESGEWLKGELKVLYNYELEFDSDKLDLLKLDWEDVRQVRGHGVHSISIEGVGVVTGNIRITENEAIITIGDEARSFDRELIISIAKGEQKESQYWSGKLTLNINARSGNTDQLDYGAQLNIKRRTSNSRFVFDYIGNYSETNSVNTANSHRANFFVDQFRTRHFFWRPVFGEYFRDPFQNISSKYTIGTGLGYHLINTPKEEWDVSAGLAYVRTEFVSVEAGTAPVTETPALVAGTSYDLELNKKVDLSASYSFQILDEDSGRYTHHMIGTISTELTSWMDFDISLIWDRIEKPTANEDGTIPDKDDYQLLLGLGFDY